MNYYTEKVQLGFGRITPGVKWLLYINGGVYLLQLISRHSFDVWFGLNSTFILNYLTIWQFVTYMFLHGGFFHIFFNMFILWIFGCEVERAWGTKEFLKYYFITGIGSAILSFFIYFVFSMNVVMIGASGAIYGIILAFAFMYPNRVITLFLFLVLPISMKAKYLAMMLAGISLFSGISNMFGETSDITAHFAHLGGMLVGYLYLKSDWRTQQFFSKIKPRVKPHKVKMKVYRSEKPEDLQKQVDNILDKINEVGYEKLTRSEKDILKKASEDLSKKSNSD